MIAQILKYATFIPWILYYLKIMLYNIKTIEEQKMDKKKYFDYINRNFFSSFNVKELFLFCVFMIFMQYKNTTVLEMLFPTIYLYLLIDLIHSQKSGCRNITLINLILQTVVFACSIIAFFVLTNDLYTTYIIMFTTSLFGSFVAYVFSVIFKIFKTRK